MLRVPQKMLSQQEQLSQKRRRLAVVEEVKKQQIAHLAYVAEQKAGRKAFNQHLASIQVQAAAQKENARPSTDTEAALVGSGSGGDEDVVRSADSNGAGSGGVAIAMKLPQGSEFLEIVAARVSEVKKQIAAAAAKKKSRPRGGARTHTGRTGGTGRGAALSTAATSEASSSTSRNSASSETEGARRPKRARPSDTQETRPEFFPHPDNVDLDNESTLSDGDSDWDEDGGSDWDEDGDSDLDDDGTGEEGSRRIKAQPVDARPDDAMLAYIEQRRRDRKAFKARLAAIQAAHAGSRKTAPGSVQPAPLPPLSDRDLRRIKAAGESVTYMHDVLQCVRAGETSLPPLSASLSLSLSLSGVCLIGSGRGSLGSAMRYKPSGLCQVGVHGGYGDCVCV